MPGVDVERGRQPSSPARGQGRPVARLRRGSTARAAGRSPRVRAAAPAAGRRARRWWRRAPAPRGLRASSGVATKNVLQPALVSAGDQRQPKPIGVRLDDGGALGPARPVGSGRQLARSAARSTVSGAGGARRAPACARVTVVQPPRSGSGRYLVARQVAEARDCSLERQLDGADRAVALLADDDLGLAADRLHLGMPILKFARALRRLGRST